MVKGKTKGFIKTKCFGLMGGFKEWVDRWVEGKTKGFTKTMGGFKEWVDGCMGGVCKT